MDYIAGLKGSKRQAAFQQLFPALHAKHPNHLPLLLLRAETSLRRVRCRQCPQQLKDSSLNSRSQAAAAATPSPKPAAAAPAASPRCRRLLLLLRCSLVLEVVRRGIV